MLNSSSTHHTMLRLGRCCIDKLRLSQPSLPHPRCRESSVEKVCWPRDSVKCASKSFHTSRQCREEVEDKSFRSQMFNSTRQRLERERREQERFARYSAPTAAGWFAPLIAITILAGGGGWYIGSLTPTPIPDTSTLPLSQVRPLDFRKTKTNLQAAWVDFKNIVGTDNVSVDIDDIKIHSGSDWSSHTALPGDRPSMIIRPGSTEEVGRIMAVCHIRKIPVTAYSGGTSLEGHFAATRGGICIDFSRMDQIIALHKEDLDVVVQPAVGWETLNDELSKDGLFFPPDPGPGAMIGGMIGTGCSGTNAYHYGTMKDWVLSLTVVLADGTIIRTRQRPRKSSAGYDLTRTFIGSEGTLGLVTEATLRLTPKPAHTNVAVASFDSIRAAATCVSRIVGQGIGIAAVEILDDVQMRCINEAGTTSRHWKESPTLFFKFAGGTQKAVREHVSLVQKHARESGSRSFEFARSEDEAVELWSARKEALWSLMAKRRQGNGESGVEDHVWTTDVAVPISRLPEIIEKTKEDIAESGLVGSIVGHAGDGNFHSLLLYNDSERDVAEGLVHRMVKRAIELEGTATGEHGVGLVKRDYLPEELGQDTVDLMRKLKMAFDPLCLLNCDKIVRMEKGGGSR